MTVGVKASKRKETCYYYINIILYYIILLYYISIQLNITWTTAHSNHERPKSTNDTLGAVKVVDEVLDEHAKWARNAVSDDVNHEWSEYNHPTPTTVRYRLHRGSLCIHFAAYFQMSVIVSLDRCVLGGNLFAFTFPLSDTTRACFASDTYCRHVFRQSSSGQFLMSMWWQKVSVPTAFVQRTLLLC